LRRFGNKAVLYFGMPSGRLINKRRGRYTADLDIGMKAAKEDLLSVPHFACFGGIVFAFARLEYLIQVTWGQANVEH